MSLYNQFVNWTGYAGYQVAEAEIEERQAERKLKRVEDTYTVQYKSEKTVAATKARVALEPEFQAAEDVVDVAFARKKLLGSLYTDLERKAQAVSRELTRRLARKDTEHRNEKYNA